MYHGRQRLQSARGLVTWPLTRDGGKGIRHGAEKSLARDLGDVAERSGRGGAGADADVSTDAAAVRADASRVLWPADARLWSADADDALWSAARDAAGLSARRSVSDAAGA